MLLELYGAFSHAGRECAAGLARYQQVGGRRVSLWGTDDGGQSGRGMHPQRRQPQLLQGGRRLDLT